jgi:hypothetical protein
MVREDRHLTVGLSHPEERLGQALKELVRQWAETSQYWKDGARQKFQKNFIDELSILSRGAIGSMAEIQRFLGQILQDCG